MTYAKVCVYSIVPPFALSVYQHGCILLGTVVLHGFLFDVSPAGCWRGPRVCRRECLRLVHLQTFVEERRRLRVHHPNYPYRPFDVGTPVNSTRSRRGTTYGNFPGTVPLKVCAGSSTLFSTIACWAHVGVRNIGLDVCQTLA